MELKDIVGYSAMILLIISVVPKKLRTIRTINFFASTFFVIYGILLGWEWPLMISNFMVSCIQIYHLFIVKEKNKV
ncbi:Uroporphyrinogen decarboxylase [uncultured Paludibacter sp.]|nr:Uroporphyrinogen decarboxylase [uncultured Paludibacter sp.]